MGWEVLQAHPKFLKGLALGKKKLRTILGYSNACDPSIISGKLPSEHLHWSSFFYSPATSPFRCLRWLRFLPSFLTDRQRVRHLLSRAIALWKGFTGYFQIYQVPFSYLPYFDYAEKKWMWGTKEGLVRGKSIFDLLLQRKIPFYVRASAEVTDEQQWREVTEQIQKEQISYAYLSLGKLDAVMHAHGTHHKDVDKVLEQYDVQIRELIKLAQAHYDEVSWYVFSDHGMHNIIHSYDLQAIIAKTGLVYGEDYVAMYDSTMARFWYFNAQARSKISATLANVHVGRVLSAEELKKLGVYFPDHLYGETIFLMHSNILLAPSFMGKKPVAGMHGFHPDDADSYAAICSDHLLPTDLTSIEQIFWLMIQELEKVKPLVPEAKKKKQH